MLSRSASGGFWALYAGSLAHHAEDGMVLTRIAVAAQDLVADESGDAWAVTSDGALHVSVSGPVDGPRLPWPMRRGVTALGDALCGITLERAPRVRCLKPGGGERDVRGEHAIEALEGLLALDPQGNALVASGATVRHLRAAGAAAVREVHGAGLDDGGKPFVSRHAGSELIVTRSDGSEQRIAAPPGVPAFGVLPIVGAVWFDARGGVESSVRIDEEAFRTEVFPHAWQLAPVRGVAARSPAEVLISTSGPEGIAVLAMPIP